MQQDDGGEREREREREGEVGRRGGGKSQVSGEGRAAWVLVVK